MCLAGHAVNERRLETQFNTNHNEKQTEKLAADHFFSSLLDHNAESTGHWDKDVLERKLKAGGFGLLIVEREQVFEVLKPTERTPSNVNSTKVLNSLTGVNIIRC